LNIAALSQALDQAAQNAGPARAGLLFSLVALLPFALVPITALLLAVATLLPSSQAFGVMVAGSLANTLLSYGLGRRYGLRLFKRLKPENHALFEALKIRCGQSGFKMALLSRCLPLPFAFAGLGAPVLGIPFGSMMAGSFVAMVPWAFFYAFFTESVRQGNLRYLGPAVAILALIMVALLLARRSLAKSGALSLPQGPLTPQTPALGPELTLYTLRGHEACQDARRELWTLRPRLKFEVRELDISVSPELDAQFHDHVPVVFLGQQKIFSFQVDENALERTLRQDRHD
jgi:uncharacterized membrane protein YdjX (TVP38/TMEM64 family)